MANAKQELMEAVRDKQVELVRIVFKPDLYEPGKVIEGTLDSVLPQLDFKYDEGFGGQELFGYIWYTDGTWSERAEYDGSEWWMYKRPPPKDINIETEL